MKNKIKTTLILSNLFFIHSLCASSNYWQCTVQDKENHSWVAKNAYERVAEGKALDGCKKNSREPNSCEPAQTPCEFFSNDTAEEQTQTPEVNISYAPRNHSVKWHCPALDALANFWLGPASGNRDRAILESKAACQMHSIVPDTCYVHNFTCTNA